MTLPAKIKSIQPYFVIYVDKKTPMDDVRKLREEIETADVWDVVFDGLSVAFDFLPDLFSGEFTIFKPVYLVKRKFRPRGIIEESEK